MRKQSTHAITSKTTPAIQQKSPSDSVAQRIQAQETIGNEHFGAKAGAMMDNVMGAIAPPPGVQTDLTVGAPGDKYEQEADRVSQETVQRLYGNNSSAGMDGVAADEQENVRLQPLAYNLQRDGGEGGGTASKALEQNISSAKSGGSELPDRDRYEKAMGADFSNVKVHTGGESDRLNRSLSSRAFTNQNHIFFKQGEFNPGTRQGDGLISHELTHVMQQNPGVISQKAETEVERSDSNQISRAPENWIQRDLVADFDTTFKSGDKQNDVTKLRISKMAFWKKMSGTFKTIRELLEGYEKNKAKPDSYLYLEKAYNLLIIKQQRNEKRTDDESAQKIVSSIKLFRSSGFDAKVKQAYVDYQDYLTLQKQGQNEQQEAQQDSQKKKSSRARIKKIVDKHKDPDLPSDDQQQKKDTDKLSGKYRKLVDKKIQGIGRIDSDRLSETAKAFREMSSKGWWRKRGKTLTEVDFLLTRSENANREGRYQEAYDFLKSAVTLMDVWLLKYEPQMSEELKAKNRAKGNVEQEEIDSEKTALVKAYKSVLQYRYLFSEHIKIASQDVKNLDTSRLGMARPGQIIGQKNVRDETTIQKLRQEYVLKKVGKRYNGECGYFFNHIYPFILDGISPTVGDKGVITLDVNFPIDPSGSSYVGFNLKIDAERKDEKEFKVYNHLQVQLGGKAGYTTSDESFGASAEGKVGFGMFVEAVGNTSKNVGQLFSYGMYRRFRESKFVPSWVTNFLWGGGKVTSAGYADAEAWATSVEEQTWGADAKSADDAKKAYVETAYMGSGKGKAGLAFGKDKVGLEASAELAMGKRYSKESLEGTGALKDGYSTETQDKKKVLGMGWGYKSKGMDTARIVLDGKLTGTYNGVNMSVELKPKYEFLADAGKEGGVLGWGNLALRKAEYQIRVGATSTTEGNDFLKGLTVAAAGGSTLVTAVTNLSKKAKGTADKAARQKDSKAGNISNALGKVSNTAVLSLGALGAFGNSGSGFTMDTGGRFRTKLTWEFPNVKDRLKEQQGLKDEIGKKENEIETLQDEIVAHKQLIKDLEKDSEYLGDPDEARAVASNLTEQDKALAKKRVKLASLRKELPPLRKKLHHFQTTNPHAFDAIYAKTKAKGEAHLEALARLNLSPVDTLSSMKYDLARRLISFKWEAEGKKWAVGSGKEILEGKKRREVLGFDMR